MDEKKLTQKALAALTKVTRAADWLVPDLMRGIKNTLRPYGLNHFFLCSGDWALRRDM